MKNAVAIVIAGIALLTTVGAHSAWGGETKVYARPGYFTWNEKVNGADFIRESGLITTLGIERQDTVADHLTIGELFEVWGGNLDFDGHDITNTRVMKTDTIYIGTREEVAAVMTIPMGLSLAGGPLAGIGHKFWIRTRSNEDWNMAYGKGGFGGSYAAGKTTLLASGGVAIPFYTRTHVNLSDMGLEDVVTEPRSQVSPFAEVEWKVENWSVGFRYEEMNFGESKKVPTRSTSGSGVAVIASNAFQPKTTSRLFALRLEYRF